MTDQELMGVAIQESLKSTEPLKCGCVIAKDGEVVASSCNSQRADSDAASQAEIKTIREAGKKLGQKNINGCIAYCTHEPCTTSLSAMLFAKVDKLFFGIPFSDLTCKRIDVDSDELIERSTYDLELMKNFMIDEDKRALK